MDEIMHNAALGPKMPFLGGHYEISVASETPYFLMRFQTVTRLTPSILAALD